MENFVKTPIKFYPKKNFEKPKKKNLKLNNVNFF